MLDSARSAFVLQQCSYIRHNDQIKGTLRGAGIECADTSCVLCNLSRIGSLGQSIVYFQQFREERAVRQGLPHSSSWQNLAFDGGCQKSTLFTTTTTLPISSQTPQQPLINLQSRQSLSRLLCDHRYGCRKTILCSERGRASTFYQDQPRDKNRKSKQGRGRRGIQGVLAGSTSLQ